MRRIAEMEDVSIKIKKLYKQATKEENWRDADYWEGVLDALKWVRDKKGEETIILKELEIYCERKTDMSLFDFLIINKT